MESAYPGSATLPRPEVEPVEANGHRDEYAGIEFVDSDENLGETQPFSMAKLRAGRDEAVKSSSGRTLHKFILTQTSIEAGIDPPMEAVVQTVNFLDRSIIGTIPGEIREMVERLYFGGNQAQKKNLPKRVRFEQSASRLKEVGWSYGIAGFVNPRLCLRKEDARPDDEVPVVWVGDIELADLTAFTQVCDGDEQLARRRLQRFSE